MIKADKSCSHVDTLSALESATAPDTKLLWLDIHGDLTAEMEGELSRVMGWHPIVLENFHLASSRPKLINFDRYSQVTLHALNLDRPLEERLTVEIDTVIAKTYLITYHKLPVRSIEETLEDLRAGRLVSLGADELLYHIVSHGIDKYAPAIEEKKELIAALEQEALYDPGQDLLERIVLLRDEIIELAVVMTPQQLILAQMATGVCRHVRPFIRPYFKDAESRMRNLIDELGSYKEMLANSLELYRSAMSSRTNDTMKVLTAMSAMFLPLTFLTGLFGMNVNLPLAHQHHAFVFIVGLCFASFVGMMAYFKIKSWF
ncbi:MAG TPA: magnesium transporter CorA family protein [Fibrobacteria bacterium]|nr:magnesium transporter CorA family protein [Fibrobacteria bacterium]